MKKLISGLLAGTMALSLAACGGSASSTAASSTAASGDAATEPAAFQTTSTWAPEGTVSLILPAGAGGDTDLT